MNETTLDERINIINDYIEHMTIKDLKTKYNVSKSLIKKIIYRNKILGQDGLIFFSKKDYQKNNISKADIKRNEVLSGNLWRVVIAITLPIFLYQFINVLYSIVDQVMVSSIGTSYVSAVAAISQIKQLISTLGSGLAAGGSILIAKYYGAFEYKKANKYANVTLTMSFIIVAFIFIMMPFSTIILRIAQVPDDLIAISELYFLLQLIEQIIMIFNSFFIGLQKAKCATKPIFIANIIAMSIKIILNAILIYGFKINSLAYVELATIISQLTIFIIGLFFVFEKNANIKISFKEMGLKSSVVKEILVVALPLFLGKFIISFGKVTVNAMCAFYGSLTIGALSVSNNLTGLITNPSIAFEESETSIVSMNLGNKNMKRSLKTFTITCIYDCIWGFIGFICIRVLFLDDIISLFALSKGNDSIEFIQAIKDIFYYDCITIPALVINNIILGFLYGYGQTFLSTLNNIFRIAIRILSLFVLQNFTSLGIESVGISMGISNVFIALFAIVVLIIFFIKVKIKGYKKMSFSDEEPLMNFDKGRIVNKDLMNTNIK